MFLFEKIAKKKLPNGLWSPIGKAQELVDRYNALRTQYGKSISDAGMLEQYVSGLMHQEEAAYKKALKKQKKKERQVMLPGGAKVDSRFFGNLNVKDMSLSGNNLGMLKGMVFTNPKNFTEAYHNSMEMARGTARPTSVMDVAAPAAIAGTLGIGAYKTLGSNPSTPMPMYGPGSYPRPMQYEQDYYH